MEGYKSVSECFLEALTIGFYCKVTDLFAKDVNADINYEKKIKDETYKIGIDIPIITILKKLNNQKNGRAKKDVTGKYKKKLEKEISSSELDPENIIYIDILENEYFMNTFLYVINEIKDGDEEITGDDIRNGGTDLYVFIENFVKNNFDKIVEKECRSKMKNFKESLESSKNELNEIITQKTVINKQNKLLNKQLEEQKNENGRLRACNFTQEEALKKEKIKIKELNTKIGELKKLNSELQLENSKFKEIDNHKKSVDLLSENAKLKKELAKKEQEKQKLKDDKDDDEKKLAELTKDNDKLKKTNAELENKYNKVVFGEKELKNKNQRLTENINDLLDNIKCQKLELINL